MSASIHTASAVHSPKLLECARCSEWYSVRNGRFEELSPGFAAKYGSHFLLHFAPDFVLEINGNASVPPALLGSNVVEVEVTGKWRGMSLAEPLALQVISTGTNIERVLRDRNCAAIRLFDCPVVLVRLHNQFYLFVLASYENSLRMAIEHRSSMALSEGRSECR